MQISTITLLLTSLMAHGIMATPLASAEESEFYELKVEQRDGGSIVQYGENKRSLAPRANDCGGWFQPKCPKVCHPTDIDQPQCDKKNGAVNTICDNLVNDLFGNQNDKLNAKTQSICYKADNGKNGCCIQWTTPKEGFYKGDFKEHAEKIKGTCSEQGISGQYKTVNIRDTCMSLCMSNRPKCKDQKDFS